MATVSSFLVSLTGDAKVLWEQDPEASMAAFGLSEPQKDAIRRGLASNDLGEVETLIDAETGVDPRRPFYWVK
jgi:hypothetical protein